MSTAVSQTPRDNQDAAGATAGPRDQTTCCPRCGYDLRGIVASWKDACPMHGLCSECGLNFEWWWMFRAQFHPWLFEHQWRKRPLRSACKTALAAPRGNRLCRETALMHPIRLVPLCLLLALLLLVASGIFAVGLAYAVKQSQGYITWGGGVADEVKQAARSTFSQLAIYVLSVAVIAPPAFLTIPTTLQRISVRPVHLVRIWLYSLIGIATAILAVVALQAGWEFLTGAQAPLWMNPLDWRLWTWDAVTSPIWLLVLVDTVRPIWIITLLWAWWWWRAACRDYLRLPDAHLIANVLMIIVLLASYLVQHAVSVIGQFL